MPRPDRTRSISAPCSRNSSVIAYVDVEEMLSKHFAVLGSTGVGKSSGVSLLLNEILKSRPNLRVFLLDVHNEYGRCFGDRAHRAQST